MTYSMQAKGISEIYTIAQHSNVCLFVQSLPASQTPAYMAGVAEYHEVTEKGATACMVIMDPNARVSVIY